MRLVLEVNIFDSVYLYFATGRTFLPFEGLLHVFCVQKYFLIDLRSHAQLFMADNIMSIFIVIFPTYNFEPFSSLSVLLECKIVCIRK